MCKKHDMAHTIHIEDKTMVQSIRKCKDGSLSHGYSYSYKTNKTNTLINQFCFPGILSVALDYLKCKINASYLTVFPSFPLFLFNKIPPMNSYNTIRGFA